MERVQKFDCATPDPSETAVHFHETEASVEKNVQYEPKNNDEVALQQLPSNFAMS